MRTVVQHSHNCTVYAAFGRNNYGQLGDGTVVDRFSPTELVALGTENSAVAAGSSHTLLLRTDGTCWGWGRNQHGQLGDSTVITRPFPAELTNLGNDNIAVDAGGDFSMVLKRNGSVAVFGAAISTVSLACEHELRRLNPLVSREC
jgi:alpha-tubulin suppressor-like RCC1 family protein